MDVADVERMRAEFFRRTRRLVIVMYVAGAVAGIALAAVALVSDSAGGGLGLVAGFALALILFAVSPLIPTSARAARALVFVAPAVGVVAADALGLGELGSDAFFLGGFGGFLLGMVVGIAAIRRRLAHDDALLLRQKRLGFDPENPSGWLRG